MKKQKQPVPGITNFLAHLVMEIARVTRKDIPVVSDPILESDTVLGTLNIEEQKVFALIHKKVARVEQIEKEKKQIYRKKNFKFANNPDNRKLKLLDNERESLGFDIELLQSVLYFLVHKRFIKDFSRSSMTTAPNLPSADRMAIRKGYQIVNVDRKNRSIRFAIDWGHRFGSDIFPRHRHRGQ